MAAGAPPLVLGGVALICGLILAFRQPLPRADLVIWTFAQSHADSLLNGAPSPLDRFETHTGQDVEVVLLEPSAMDVRLLSLLRGGRGGDHLPDVLQLETLSSAKFLDGPIDQIGLLPLDDFLDRDGLRDRVLTGRLAAWQRHGRTYGVPVDVHPVTLTYRRDLFDQVGLDPSAARTWPELAEILRAYVAYWRDQGHPQRLGLELARTRSDHLTLMLQQRGVPLVDAQGRPNLTDPLVAETILFYADLLAGPAPLGGPTSDGHTRFARDLSAGRVAMIWTPDWRVSHLRSGAPELAGKLAMMPLPRFAPEDAPTAVWGGTMLGIPREVADPDAAWALLRHLAFSESALDARRAVTGTVSPIPARWGTAAYVEPDPFFGDQSILTLYAALAPQTPTVRTTALTNAAAGHLAAIVSRVVDARAKGSDAAALRAQLATWLAEAQADLEQRAAFLGGAGPQSEAVRHFPAGRDGPGR